MEPQPSAPPQLTQQYSGIYPALTTPDTRIAQGPSPSTTPAASQESTQDAVRQRMQAIIQKTQQNVNAVATQRSSLEGGKAEIKKQAQINERRAYIRNNEALIKSCQNTGTTLQNDLTTLENDVAANTTQQNTARAEYVTTRTNTLQEIDDMSNNLTSTIATLTQLQQGLTTARTIAVNESVEAPSALPPQTMDTINQNLQTAQTQFARISDTFSNNIATVNTSIGTMNRQKRNRDSLQNLGHDLSTQVRNQKLRIEGNNQTIQHYGEDNKRLEGEIRDIDSPPQPLVQQTSLSPSPSPSSMIARVVSVLSFRILGSSTSTPTSTPAPASTSTSTSTPPSPQMQIPLAETPQ